MRFLLARGEHRCAHRQQRTAVKRPIIGNSITRGERVAFHQFLVKEVEYAGINGEDQKP